MPRPAFIEPFCYTAVYSEIEQKLLLNSIEPSFVHSENRSEFPQVYFGDWGPTSNICIDGIDGAYKVAKRMNAILAEHAWKLNELSTYQLENALRDILNNGEFNYGFWSSKRHPLEQMPQTKNPLAPQRRATRRKPRKHTVLEIIQRRMDEGQTANTEYHRVVSKPYQPEVKPLASFLENNLCRVPKTPEQLKKERDEEEIAAERIFEKMLAEVREHQEKEKKIAEIEAAELVGIGSLSLNDGKLFCEWCREKHGVEAFQVTIAPDCSKGKQKLYKVLIPSVLLAKVRKSIRSKFAVVKQRGFTVAKKAVKKA